MAIEFNCPHCGVLYKLKDEMAGKSGKCKNAKCQKQILIPYHSTVSENASIGPALPIDAEALAAAAYAEEKPAVPEKQVVSKKLAVVCQFCEHKFEVDASMGGKNTPCPECRKIIRVPKPVEDKPADWRTGASNRPSLAKATEPIPAGAWDVQAKGVSGEALRKAGVLEIEDDEEPGERRIRRIKQAVYGLAFLGILVFAVGYILKSRREGKQEHWMDLAVKEIETVGPKKPIFSAGIQRFAGEYSVRAAKKSDDLQAAITMFHKSRDLLQNAAGDEDAASLDRNAMMVELGLSLTVCGGDSTEVGEGRRLGWDAVHPLIRKCFDKLPAGERELRSRGIQMLTRKFAESEQPGLAETVARNCSVEADQSELVGRVGIELFLLGKKDLAQRVLSKSTSPSPQAELTALWLALNADKDEPPKEMPHELPPKKGPKTSSSEAILGYSEGRALQGRLSDAREIANLATNNQTRLAALNRVAAVALSTGKQEEAGKCVDGIAGCIQSDKKTAPLPPWLLVEAAELATRVNKPEVVQAVLEACPSDNVRSWAKLAILRLKLAGLKTQKAEESLLEPLPQPEQLNLAQALAQAEVARHNAAAGESSGSRGVEALPKGIVRAFGYAGIALGAQDRGLKK